MQKHSASAATQVQPLRSFGGAEQAQQRKCTHCVQPLRSFGGAAAQAQQRKCNRCVLLESPCRLGNRDIEARGVDYVRGRV